ncbi:MAG: hypothetical protein Q4F11_04295 [Eubacteriales bacterium]|nr:hypothetical protein [Eubacteriales bacterium]
MKKLKSYICIILITGIMLTLCMGCARKPEAVITSDGEDITEEALEYPTLEVSHEQKFSYEDLVVGSLKYMMTEDDVRGMLGTPANSYESKEKTESTTQSEFSEHVLSYNELTLIFMPFDGVYRLTAAASVSSKDTFTRGIRVGDKLEDILGLFYRDSDCMNNNYLAQDKTTVLGKYLYGNFTIEDLENVNTKAAVNYGLINYSGASSIESAETYMVEFTCFDSRYKNTTASINDDFAQLAFDLDNSGVITGIRWYYYPEENN